MGRKRSAPKAAKKKRGGLLTGMRSGFKSAASTVTGGKSKPGGEIAAPRSRVTNVLLNILTVVMVIVAAALVLRRCGVVKF